MNVILTGVTGTLGSQIIYELVQQKELNKVYLLIRNKGAVSAKERFQLILENEAAPVFIRENCSAILEKVRVLETDEFLNPSAYLNSSESNYFIHSAGCVNLTTDRTQKDLLFKENLEFTKTIFEAFSAYIKKFTYISTAFSIGDIGGLIDNDYHNKEPQYRNFYEASKHATEKFLRGEESKTGVQIQILRPSVLGGNIFKTSKYFISKYMVYYLVGRFFYNNPLGKGSSMRLALNSESALNIVPVDYVAKVIAKVFTKNIEQLNIVQSKSTNVMNGMKRIVEAVGFNDYSFVNTLDENFVLEAKNKLEDIYYRTIGLHLNKYLTSSPYEFDTMLLESIVPMPIYNVEDYLADTIRYAKDNGFKSAW
jgi:nucleoside-diphosphate-sugar epimerase